MIDQLPKITFQLVFGRCEDREYPTVDVTYWTEHDVQNQDELTTRSLWVCPQCYGAMSDTVCSSCFEKIDPEERWEGLIMTGSSRFVATEIAKLWEKVVVPSDISSIYLPVSIASEQALLGISRRHPDEVMAMGAYRVYKADMIVRDMASGRPLSSLIETFLKV